MRLDFAFGSCNAFIAGFALVAIPSACKVADECGEFVAYKGAFGAVLWVVWVFATEYLSVGGVGFEACLCVLFAYGVRYWCFAALCLAEFALAVPAVAGLVFVPKGVVHWAHRSPKDPMVGTGVWRGRWNPLEVGIDIGFGTELFPFGGILRAQHSGVVFGL